MHAMKFIHIENQVWSTGESYMFEKNYEVTFLMHDPNGKSYLLIIEFFITSLLKYARTKT